jgi:phosphoglycerate dehydrogenase-like enzyme
MTWTILVPVESRPSFDEQPIPDVRPAFYRLREPSLAQRGLRKLGWLDADRIFTDALELFECEDCLREVSAVWLSTAYMAPSHLTWLLDQLPELKWAYSQKTGTDHFNLGYFRRRGVKVSNNGQLSSRRVAEMALADIVAQAKRLPEHVLLQRNRRWRSLPCDDLSRQTVGIIGTGNIGREVAKLCRGVGLRVIGASRDPGRLGADAKAYDRLYRLGEELDELLGESDYVVLALPLTPETRGLISTERLSRLRRKATLVNVARGALVDENALCRALRRSELGAAYIDCPIQMPPPPWSPLYRTPNLFLTHYSSVNSARALQDAFEQFKTGLEQLHQTGEPPNRVV